MTNMPCAAILTGLLAMMASPVLANTPAPASGTTPPRLVIAIAVDQLSSDVWAEHRPHFTGGLKRLSQGVVFPKGYQSHAATETCPGHSTILTGARPARTGVIANNWIVQSIARDEKRLYCAEDPDAPGATARDYAPSLRWLKVDTLGDRMKAANPAARVVSVGLKDRGALMMGGRRADQMWWWGGKGFVSYRGTDPSPLVQRVNAGIAATVAQPRGPLPLPAHCAAVDRPIKITDQRSIGTGRFERAAGEWQRVAPSPEGDAATLALAGAMIDDMGLGRGKTTDLIAIALSASDYIGHAYGTAGAEMCIQIAQLDTSLGAFFDRLDAQGIDYTVVLTADHGGHDAPERLRQNAAPDAQRVERGLNIAGLNESLAARTGIAGPLLLGDGSFGDIYLHDRLTAAERAKVSAAALALWRAHPQVEMVFTHDDLVRAAPPSGPPESWPLIQIAKASFDPDRSGDFVVLLKPRVTPISEPGNSVATHGSPWDYDRRVPILFWRRGIVPFEQPLGVETVDIMPTLAAQIGLAVPAGDIDGRCLDLVAGPENGCAASETAAATASAPR